MRDASSVTASFIAQYKLVLMCMACGIVGLIGAAAYYAAILKY